MALILHIFLLVALLLSLNLSPNPSYLCCNSKLLNSEPIRLVGASRVFSKDNNELKPTSTGPLGVESLQQCLRHGRFQVVEDAVTEFSGNKEMKTLFKRDVHGDRLDFESCLRNVKSVYSSDLPQDTATLPIQDTYYCLHISEAWPKEGFHPSLHTMPRLQYERPRTCGLPEGFVTLEALHRANKLLDILKAGSKLIMFGDSLTRQLFIAIDCRIHALGLVKERRVLATYTVPRKWAPTPGLRELHVRITLLNGALVEFYFTSVPGSKTSSFSIASLTEIKNILPEIVGADIVVVGSSAANNPESYFKALKSGALAQASKSWGLAAGHTLLLHSQVPKSTSMCSRPTSPQYGTCPWTPLIYESQEERDLERTAVREAGGHLLDIQSLLSQSTKVLWPNGTSSGVQGFWYCDRQHQLIDSGLPDVQADLLFTMITMLRQNRTREP